MKVLDDRQMSWPSGAMQVHLRFWSMQTRHVFTLLNSTSVQADLERDTSHRVRLTTRVETVDETTLANEMTERQTIYSHRTPYS